MEEPASDKHQEKDAYGGSKATKFHFKPKSERSKRRHRANDDGDYHEEQRSKRRRSERDPESRRSHREPKRKDKHRRSDYDRSFARNGEYNDPDHRYRESIYDGLDGEGLRSPEADPDDAFRESLFDALADDEGAAYWEGVYGQPIHVYPNTKPGPDGKLERMSEEEYAEYVRTKMWEKSHQHILEERAARERARQKQRRQQDDLEEEADGEEEEREKVRRQMEESLRRGEARKKAKEAEVSWVNYLRKWEDLKNKALAQEPESGVRETIPWPVASGRSKHVEKDEIERFLKSSSAWREDAVALLKAERVRWHPDKMQQRFGQHIDSETMRLVTAVFQVIDRLWNERRT
ncbi:hypothetical protein BU26DRAFT_331386 [Trematosphaeria pertusa]|uniref:Uncharacterized protein n=1 Tax=Trematosphaeria pertusa TaxID=390896 RepID=A0A6A6ID14_9PLEO|nr:uncharacterized protein BU26DRAFT_331386 [Trematosphaeria pertusa]KAF2248316.1 hypothetical protein BU26DRAFT_331386 [Trematosphaeria pertusa]